MVERETCRPFGRAEGGTGLGDERVRREGRHAGTKCEAEHDDDVKGWSLQLM